MLFTLCKIKLSWKVGYYNELAYNYTFVMYTKTRSGCYDLIGLVVNTKTHSYDLIVFLSIIRELFYFYYTRLTSVCSYVYHIYFMRLLSIAVLIEKTIISNITHVKHEVAGRKG